MASLIRALDCSSSRCTWRVRASLRPDRSSEIAPLEVALGLAALAGKDVEPADGQCRCQENAGHIGRCAGNYGDHHGSQPERTGLGQRGGGKGALNLIGNGSRLGFPVVAPHHLAGNPPDRVEQRLAVVAEAGTDIADHALAVSGELPPLDVAADVLPQPEIPLHDPVDDPADLLLDRLAVSPR